MLQTRHSNEGRMCQASVTSISKALPLWLIRCLILQLFHRVLLQCYDDVEENGDEDES